MIQIWSQMHGYITGINNTLLDYMRDNPVSLRKRLVDRIGKNILRTLQTLKQRSGLKVIS